MYNGNVAVIQLGQIGLLTDVASGEIPRGALIRAQNVSFETGMITKAPGSLKYNDTVLPAGIVALFDWWPNTVTQRLIAACTNGCIYRDIGDKTFSSATAITTGLGTLTPRSMFVEGGQETLSRSKKLFLVAHSDHYDHACIFAEECKYSGYDKSDKWERLAMKYLAKGGWQVVLFRIEKEHGDSAIIFDEELPQISEGKNPEDFGYKIVGVYNTTDELADE